VTGPKVLLFDIETAPVLAYVWGLWDQNVGLNQIHTDWYVLSWAAKWLGSPEVFYRDQRWAPSLEDDREILASLWDLLDEADIVVTQNGKKFDQKKLFARFILNGFRPPSSFKHIDTLAIAKRHFGFTSNKLEYMSEKLCRVRKLKHKRFPGFDLWRECLADNIAAWDEMERYNRQDVLALEELWQKLSPWDAKGPNFSLYHETADHVCRCGSRDFMRQGWAYTAAGKFQRYLCRACGSESRDKVNVLAKDKRAALRGGG
jgi:hypothetical protein